MSQKRSSYALLPHPECSCLLFGARLVELAKEILSFSCQNSCFRQDLCTLPLRIRSNHAYFLTLCEQTLPCSWVRSFMRDIFMSLPHWQMTFAFTPSSRSRESLSALCRLERSFPTLSERVDGTFLCPSPKMWGYTWTLCQKSRGSTPHSEELNLCLSIGGKTVCFFLPQWFKAIFSHKRRIQERL